MIEARGCKIGGAPVFAANQQGLGAHIHQHGAAQRRSLQLRAAQIGIRQIGLPRVHQGQVGHREQRAGKVGSPQHRAVQQRRAEVNTTEVETGQVSPRKVGAPPALATALRPGGVTGQELGKTQPQITEVTFRSRNPDSAVREIDLIKQCTDQTGALEVGAGYRGTDQNHALKACAGKIGAGQVRPPHVASPQIGLGEVSPRQYRAVQIGIPQIGLTEEGVRQLGPFKPGLDNLGSQHRRRGHGLRLPYIASVGRHEYAFAQVNPREVGADQSGVVHGDTAHVGIHQNRLGEIDPRQVGTEQVGAPQVAANHPAAAQTGAAQIGLGKTARREIEARQVAELQAGAMPPRTPRQICVMGRDDRPELVGVHRVQPVWVRQGRWIVRHVGGPAGPWEEA